MSASTDPPTTFAPPVGPPPASLTTEPQAPPNAAQAPVPPSQPTPANIAQAPSTGAPLDVASAIDTVTTAVTNVLPASLTGASVPAGAGTVAAAEPAPTQPQAHGTPALPPRPEEDPQIAALQAMFPDFDATILQSVLDSVNGDQDRAIDALLGMSDPSYVSQEPERPPAPETNLDEELARRLTLEDEDRHARRQLAQPAQESPYQTYHPQAAHPTFTDQWGYATATSANQIAPQGARDKDTVTEIQEQFTKIAETGKNAFTSLFSKVKSKIQEFEEQQTRGYNNPPSGTAAPAPGPTHPPSGPPSYFDARFNAGQAGPSGTVHQGNTPSIPVASPGYAAPTQAQPMPTRPLDPTGGPGPVTSVLGSSPLARSSMDARSSTETPRPPMTSPGPPTPNIDPVRVGMFPKQPVSLLREPTGASAPASGAVTPASAPAPAPHKQASEDDLGYM